MKTKIYPAEPMPKFVLCGQCGGWHSLLLPGSVDCRDDAHRFAIDELDLRYGPFGWEEVELDIDDPAECAISVEPTKEPTMS